MYYVQADISRFLAFNQWQLSRIKRHFGIADADWDYEVPVNFIQAWWTLKPYLPRYASYDYCPGIRDGISTNHYVWTTPRTKGEVCPMCLSNGDTVLRVTVSGHAHTFPLFPLDEEVRRMMSDAHVFREFEVFDTRATSDGVITDTMDGAVHQAFLAERGSTRTCKWMDGTVTCLSCVI